MSLFTRDCSGLVYGLVLKLRRSSQCCAVVKSPYKCPQVVRSPSVPCLSRERRKAAASGHLQSPLQHSGHLVVAVALVVHEDAVVVAVLPRELQVREELLVELGALVRLMRLVLLVRSWCAWCAYQLAR